MSYVCVCVCVCVFVLSFTAQYRVRGCVYVRALTQTHIQIHAYTCTSIHNTHTCIHTCTHMHSCTHTQVDTYTHMHTFARTHTHAVARPRGPPHSAQPPPPYSKHTLMAVACTPQLMVKRLFKLCCTLLLEPLPLLCLPLHQQSLATPLPPRKVS